MLVLQTVPFVASWQFEQQSSLESSQTEPLVNLHVLGSQQGSFLQPEAPPQSQSSPCSTMPFPHCCPVKVCTFLLSERQLDLTLLRFMAEQMLPTEQALKLLMLLPVEGFMMNWPLASQVVVLSTQHCWDWTVTPSLHVWLSQS